MTALLIGLPHFAEDGAAMADSTGAKGPCVEIATAHFPPGVAVNGDCLPVAGCHPRAIYVHVRIIGVGLCRDGE